MCAKEINQHRREEFLKNLSCLQCWNAWGTWGNTEDRKIFSSISRKIPTSHSFQHAVLRGFILSFLQVVAECKLFCNFLLQTCLSPLPLCFAAWEAAGHSLLSAVRYLEHGAVPGGDGHWQVPHSPSWLQGAGIDVWLPRGGRFSSHRDLAQAKSARPAHELWVTTLSSFPALWAYSQHPEHIPNPLSSFPALWAHSQHSELIPNTLLSLFPFPASRTFVSHPALHSAAWNLKNQGCSGHLAELQWEQPCENRAPETFLLVVLVHSPEIPNSGLLLWFSPRCWSKFSRMIPTPGNVSLPESISLLLLDLFPVDLLGAKSVRFGHPKALQGQWHWSHLSHFSPAYGSDSRPPMAIFELLDYIVNEVIYQLKNLHFTL